MNKNSKPKKSNASLALSLLMLSVGMLGLAYASVPLYRVFCQVTGYGGATGRADVAPVQEGARKMTIRFDANVNGLDWQFTPAHTVTVTTGEQKLISYTAKNTGKTATTGVATFNITPEKAGGYFDKIACFCFINQTLQPGEEVNMPVSFFVDPDIEKDPNLSDVTTITLSYTFFPAKE
jgi:cytochrome c oxidase assembly protein subunit 11